MTGKWVVKSKGNWFLFELVGSPRDILSSSSYRGSTFFFFTKTGFSTISVESVKMKFAAPMAHFFGKNWM